nr:MAG TPA: hypothetical protein [Caudoviricetes sp.]
MTITYINSYLQTIQLSEYFVSESSYNEIDYQFQSLIHARIVYVS